MTFRFLRMALVLALSWTTVSYADAFICLTGFAAFSGAEENAELTSQTYWKLVDTLAPRMTPESFRQFLESGDPFTIPEGVSSLSALDAHMKKFRGMLAEKGWDNQTTRKRLLAEIGRRAGQLEQMEVARKQALENTWSDINLQFKPHQPPGVSEKYLVAITHDSPRKLVLLDRTTRAQREYPVPEGESLPPYFSADGTEIFYPQFEGTLLRIPLEGGAANFQAATKVKTKNLMSGATTEVKPHPNGKILYVSDNSHHLARIDLKTNRAVSVKPDFLTGFVVRDWGLLPGTNHLWLIDQGSEGRTIHQFKANARGEATSAAAPWRFEKNGPTGLAFSADGKSAIGFSHEGGGILLHLDFTHRKAVSLVPEGTPPRDFGMTFPGAMHPTLPQAAVVTSLNGTYLLRIVDMEKKTIVKSIPLEEPPNPAGLVYTPDGKGLLVSGHQKTQLLNLHNLLTLP